MVIVSPTWQFKAKELVFRSNCRESLSLDGGWAKFDSVEHVWREEVNSSIDLVSTEHLRLLHKSDLYIPEAKGVSR